MTAHKGRALAGFDVLELDDLQHVALAVVKGDAVLKIACYYHVLYLRGPQKGRAFIEYTLFYTINAFFSRGFCKKIARETKKRAETARARLCGAL